MTGDSEMESQGKCGSLLSWVLSTAYKHLLSSARNIMWIVAVSTCCFFMIKQVKFKKRVDFKNVQTYLFWVQFMFSRLPFHVSPSIPGNQIKLPDRPLHNFSDS